MYEHYLCHSVLWGHNHHYPCVATHMNQASPDHNVLCRSQATFQRQCKVDITHLHI